MEQQSQDLTDINTAIDIMQYILAATKENRLKIVILMWTWWCERNRVREGDTPQSVQQIIHGIHVYSNEIQKLYANEGTWRVRRQKRWEKPPGETLKLNCDGSFNHEGKHGGWGFIIRDEDGDVVSASCGRLDHVLEPLQAELVACLQGVQAALDLGIGRLVIETDALMVVQACTSTAYDMSSVGYLAQELRSMVDSNFQFFKFAYVPRECNRVADALAEQGVGCVMGAVSLMGSLPACIQTLVADDLAMVE